MLSNIGHYGFIIASIGYGILTLLLLLTYRRQHLRHLLILVTSTTIFWAISEPLRVENPTLLDWHLFFDVMKTGTWCWVLLQILKPEEVLPPPPQIQATKLNHQLQKYSSNLLLVSLALGILIFNSQPIEQMMGYNLAQEYSLVIWLALIVLGLRLIERIYRNTNKAQRWSLKYLCMGVGGMFSYDFFMYSDALLFKQLSPDIFQARGFINALAVPLIAVSIARNPNWKIDIHVSRQVVFHSMTFIGSGLYLVIMALTAYTIKFYGGQWGSIMQTSFMFGALLLLLTLLFSDEIRAKSRVFLSKHFFSYKYDYRNEWLNFNKRLGKHKGDIPSKVCEAVGALVDSSGGVLWTKNTDLNGKKSHSFEQLCNWEYPEFDGNTEVNLEPLESFTLEKGWIIDLDDYSLSRESYLNLEIPSELLAIPKRWLLIPLFHQQKILGWLLLQHSPRQSSLNWEDRDLLKMAAQQGVVHLVQYLADIQLVEARQFEAFNRLSTYVIHDLKNILAQQSLIVANAQKHKHNPAFIDDVISTVEHSVARMTKLMAQMRNGQRGEQKSTCKLCPIFSELVIQHGNQNPIPKLELSEGCDENVSVYMDRDQLKVVFSHLIKNAQEATDATGEITLTISHINGLITAKVNDNGCGMSDQFIRDRLFSPFDSTKGLTGMGIGVFESRNVIQTMGGELSVTSQLGQGTCFSVTLPCRCCQPLKASELRSGESSETLI